MEILKVNKYQLEYNLTILNRLFLKGDMVYIQDYDPINGGEQSVFLTDKTLVGKITSDQYWELRQKLIKLD